MVIHSRRKSERKPIQKVEETPVVATGPINAVSEENFIPADYTKAASTEEKINKKPRKKKKKA